MNSEKKTERATLAHLCAAFIATGEENPIRCGLHMFVCVPDSEPAETVQVRGENDERLFIVSSYCSLLQAEE